MRIHTSTIILFSVYISFSCQSEQPSSESNLKDRSIISGDSTGVSADTILANKYFTKAEDLAKTAQYDSANNYFEAAILLYEEAKYWKKSLKCYNLIGNNLRKQGKYDQAMEKLYKALEIGLNKFGETHPDVARSYNIIGVIYRQKGYYDQALEFFNKSLAICQQTYGENHADVAKNYNSIGNVYFIKDDYDNALKYYQESLRIGLQVLGENHPDIAMFYNNIGVVYHEKGHNDKALDYYGKSLTLRLQLLGKNHPHVAQNYNNIGVIHLHKGDYDKAMEYYHKSLAILIQIYGENHPEVAQSFNNIGVIHLHKGDYDKAIEYYHKSLAIWIQFYGENHPAVAQSFNNIGGIYYEKENYDKAIEYYNKSLAIGLQLFTKNQSRITQSYNYNMGIIYQRKHEYDKALEYQNKSLSTRLQLFGAKHPDVASSYNAIGEIYSEKSDFEKALYYTQKSINSVVSDFNHSNIYMNPSLKNILSENQLLTSLTTKADILEKLFFAKSHEIKDIRMSLATYQLASELIDNMHRGYKAEGSKLLLGEKTKKFYEHAIQTALKLHEITNEVAYKEKAFLFSQKSKAGILLQSIQETQAKKFAGIPDHLLEREQDLRIDLTFYETGIQKEKQNYDAGKEDKIIDLENRYFSLKTEYEFLIKTFEEKYPKYYELKYQSRTITVKELQKTLPANMAMLEYFVGDSAIFIFVISKNEFSVAKVGKDSLFEQQVNQLRSGIFDQNYTHYSESAYLLYQLLLMPIEDKISGKELIVIPDEIISFIPFEALLTHKVDRGTDSTDYSKLSFLLEKHTVSYTYSASLLLEPIKRNSSPAERDYLAFAPIFAPAGVWKNAGGRTSITANQALDTGRSFYATSLPASRVEVLSIQNLFNEEYSFFDRWFGEKCRVYLGAEANEEKLKSITLEKYRYLHFATHAFVNESKPKLSGLFLASDSTSIEDGILRMGEIFNLNLNADLVVLSACETGLGQIAKGEGLIGLARGFFYAGAANLIVSLWQVNDYTTSHFMVDFYKNMLEGLGKAQALRKAKQQMIRYDLQSARPFHWAPFILIRR